MKKRNQRTFLHILWGRERYFQPELHSSGVGTLVDDFSSRLYLERLYHLPLFFLSFISNFMPSMTPLNEKLVPNFAFQQIATLKTLFKIFLLSSLKVAICGNANFWTNFSLNGVIEGIKLDINGRKKEGKMSWKTNLLLIDIESLKE